MSEMLTFAKVMDGTFDMHVKRVRAALERAEERHAGYRALTQPNVNRPDPQVVVTTATALLEAVRAAAAECKMFSINWGGG